MLTVVSYLFSLLLKRRSNAFLHANGNLTSDQLVRLSSSSACQLLEMVKSIIPELHHGMHKGQAGRVAIVGGCKEYTGAPYFAAISALKVGADLSHVFCTGDAAPVIKSYSPELIVHPILDNNNVLSELSEWLPRFHVLVIGPGLGREEQLMKTTAAVILRAKERQLPLIIDADGLYLVTQDPSIIYGYDNVILTPNVAEFGRLYKKIFSRDPDPQESVTNVKQLSREMGNVTIVQKGAQDIISNGEHVLICTEPCSPRRCGGQGDLLSGSMGTFSVWASMAGESQLQCSLVSTYGRGMCAAYAACLLTRRCNSLAFKSHGRSMTTTDMISQIHSAFEGLFS
ncbi:ATP-dependent (S)-NAD(P)H-hydrate dehydratase [Aplysia californica]|uniref:ATP-dependent (S)-NAD(P)H-hydrate dehydratase n=1 Tax=Aplysia californica TaxID=6500 RepID=A0ABM0K7Y3_APLCA|nr:ATP-dependent (S)-NAD(P)H-hydrate dehydratase [Aplysia californica]